MNNRTQNPLLNRSNALGLWHRVNLGAVLDDGPDLSSRQMAIFMSVYLENGPHTVRSLAAKLSVTKAVITRALNTLNSHGFIDRGPDLRDKRSVLVKRTARGSRYLSEFGERILLESKRDGSDPKLRSSGVPRDKNVA